MDLAEHIRCRVSPWVVNEGWFLSSETDSWTHPPVRLVNPDSSKHLIAVWAVVITSADVRDRFIPRTPKSSSIPMGVWNCPISVDSVRKKIGVHHRSQFLFHMGRPGFERCMEICLQAQVDQLACIKADQNNKCEQHWRSPSRCCVMATNLPDSDNGTSSVTFKDPMIRSRFFGSGSNKACLSWSVGIRVQIDLTASKVVTLLGPGITE